MEHQFELVRTETETDRIKNSYHGYGYELKTTFYPDRDPGMGGRQISLHPLKCRTEFHMDFRLEYHYDFGFRIINEVPLIVITQDKIEEVIEGFKISAAICEELNERKEDMFHDTRTA